MLTTSQSPVVTASSPSKFHYVPSSSSNLGHYSPRQQLPQPSPSSLPLIGRDSASFATVAAGTAKVPAAVPVASSPNPSAGVVLATGPSLSAAPCSSSTASVSQLLLRQSHQHPKNSPSPRPSTGPVRIPQQEQEYPQKQQQVSNSSASRSIFPTSPPRQIQHACNDPAPPPSLSCTESRAMDHTHPSSPDPPAPQQAQSPIRQQACESNSGSHESRPCPNPLSPSKRRNPSDEPCGIQSIASDGTDSGLTSRKEASGMGSESLSKRARPEVEPKVLPLRYETMDVDDLVVLISHMLGELITTNDPMALTTGRLTRFHSRTAPGITVRDYLHRLAKHATLTPAVLLSMVYYIDRLCSLYPDFTINTLTVHRFLITAATVGAKGLSDSFWNNTTYARVGGVRVQELKTLELEFLTRVDWKIVPQPEVLEAYYKGLIKRCPEYVLNGDDQESTSVVISSSSPSRSPCTDSSGLSDGDGEEADGNAQMSRAQSETGTRSATGMAFSSSGGG